MYLSDDTLEIICNYFQLNEIDKTTFIEQIRSLEAEVIFKSFLVYYETHKSPIQLQYLEKLGEGLERDPKTYLVKFRDLFSAELANNPDAVVFVEKKVVDLIVDLIKAFTKGKDRELVKEIVLSMFENRRLYEAGSQLGPNDEQPAK